MKAFVLAIAGIFFAPVVFAQDSAILPAEKIKILSWNIYMLPGPLGFRNKDRADAIGKLLADKDYDVIVFQEAFHRKARKRVRELLEKNYPYHAGPANQKFLSLKTNSGVWIFSRYPIKRAESIVFQYRHGIDAMSRKGALLIEIEVNHQSIQIVGTHLQNEGEETRRLSQCNEIFERLLKKNERLGVPQVVCGDFNINRNAQGSGYQCMLEALDATDGDLSGSYSCSYDRSGNDLHVEAGATNDLIDYILIRPNMAWVMGKERKIQVLRSRWDSNHEDLSDHYSIEAEVFFQNVDGIYTVAAPSRH